MNKFTQLAGLLLTCSTLSSFGAYASCDLDPLGVGGKVTGINFVDDLVWFNLEGVDKPLWINVDHKHKISALLAARVQGTYLNVNPADNLKYSASTGASIECKATQVRVGSPTP